MIIELKVLSSSIYCKNGELVSGNGEGTTAVFSFDGTWTGYAKTAVMFRVFGTQYSVPLQNDACPVPSELLNGAGRLYIGVYGTADGKTLSTGFTSVEIFAGAADGGVSEPPEAYVYTRLLEMITNAVNNTQLLRTETEERLEEHRAAIDALEKSRIDAENIRNSNEQERIAGEAERTERESLREARENGAAAAEEERRLAELRREANEEERIRSCVSKSYLDHFIANQLGDISSALDELHAYAASVLGGGDG